MTEVVVEHEGDARDATPADIVVVSCGAANSAKLLLASANDKHPQRPGQRLRPGRAQLHVPQQPGRAGAVARKPNPTVFQKTLGLNDFYFGGDDFDYPLGNIQMVGKSQAEMYRGEKPLETKLAPAADARATWPATRSTSGSRPRTCRGPDNRVTLRAGRERPAALHADATTSRKKRLYHQLKSMLGHARDAPRPPDPAPRLPEDRHPGRRVSRTRPGTCRFGADPADLGARTRDCRAHELDNLYVVDTSFFPSIGAVNPALTAMANALRVGDHLLERLGAPRSGAEPGVSADGQRRHVIVVGGGFAGARLRAAAGASTATCASRCSTATTTTSSSRCCTRWRRRSSARATSRMSLRKLFREHPNVAREAGRGGVDRPGGARGHDHGRRALGRRRDRAGGRVAAELLRHARSGPSTPSRSTR